MQLVSGQQFGSLRLQCSSDPGTGAVACFVGGVDTAVVLSSVVLEILPHLLDGAVEALVGLLLLGSEVMSFVCGFVRLAS